MTTKKANKRVLVGTPLEPLEKVMTPEEHHLLQQKIVNKINPILKNINNKLSLLTSLHTPTLVYEEDELDDEVLNFIYNYLQDIGWDVRVETKEFNYHNNKDIMKIFLSYPS